MDGVSSETEGLAHVGKLRIGELHLKKPAVQAGTTNMKVPSILLGTHLIGRVALHTVLSGEMTWHVVGFGERFNLICSINVQQAIRVNN